MEQNSPILYILLAILVTNLIRVLPMLLIKGPIHNTFLLRPACASSGAVCMRNSFEATPSGKP